MDHVNWGFVGFLIVLLIGSIGFLYLSFKANQPFRMTKHLDGRIVGAVDQVSRSYAARGWGILAMSETSAAFTRHKGPSLLTAIVLLTLGIIPGVLYLFLGGKDLSAHLSIQDGTDGRVAEITGNATGYFSARDAAHALNAIERSQVT